MLRYRKPFLCEILTPEGVVRRDQAVSVLFPTSDGLMGILGGRAPLVAMLGAGPLVVEDCQADRQQYFVFGGFVQVRENHVTVLAEECTPVKELDREAAWENLQRAKRLPGETAAEIEHRDRLTTAARTKFALIQAYRRRRAR